MEKKPTKKLNPTSDKKRSSQYVLVAKFSGLGWMIVGITVIFTLSGWWLDSIFDTGPWLLVVGVFIGGVVSGFVTYKMATSFISNL